MKRLIAIVLGLCVAFAVAQVNPDPLDPATWFESQEAVFVVATIFAAWIVKLTTALGKDWFGTDGLATVYLSAGLSLAIAGVGGYLALGYLSDAGGLVGALQAAAMALLSWLGANASAKYDRQAHAAAVERAERAKTKLFPQ
jgi:hypothetical protein